MNRTAYPDRGKLEKHHASMHSSYIQVLELLQRRLRTKLIKEEIHFTLKFRVKTFESYYEKLLRRLSEEKLTGELLPIHDILAIRVVCPFLEDLEQVENILRGAFRVHEVERKGAEHTFREFGYRSTHLLLEIPYDIVEKYPNLDVQFCEIQIRTFLQDAWAEVEHELIYKNRITPLDEPLRRKLAALNANLTLSDIIFQEIREYQRQLHSELEKRRHSFACQLEEQKPGLTAFDKKKNECRKNKKRPIISSDNMDELLLEALYAHNDKDFTSAIDIYTRILEKETAPFLKAVVLVHRGMAFFSESRYEDALSDFQAATECEPENGRAFYLLGIVNRVMDNNAAAVKALQRSVELKPFNFDTLFALGRTFFETGDFPAALEYCEKALLLQPESSPAQEFRRLVISRMKL
ncbi:MAG: tetratricopeptide repeat protein [Chitinispirillaceae bacterium]